MKRFYRSRTNQVVAGVCGGLAEYTNIDATLVRILFVLLLIGTGLFPFGIAYLLVMLVVPYKPSGPDVVSEQ